MTALGSEPDTFNTENLQGSDIAGVQTEVQEDEQSRHKAGCGGPGGMCCCPCGALKGSADGESKKKMEKVLCALDFCIIINNTISHAPCLVQLELTLLRIESRLKDIPNHGEELTVDNMAFMVDVDEIE